MTMTMDKKLYCIKCGAIIEYVDGLRVHASEPVAQSGYDEHCRAEDTHPVP